MASRLIGVGGLFANACADAALDFLASTITEYKS
jgi:hypothetical protein